MGRLAQENLNTLEKIATNAVTRPQIPEYKQASKILQDYLYKLLTSEETIAKLMNDAAKETRELLGYG